MHLSSEATLYGELPRPFIAAHGPKSLLSGGFGLISLLPRPLCLITRPLSTPPTLTFTLSLFFINLFLLATRSRARQLL